MSRYEYKDTPTHVPVTIQTSNIIILNHVSFVIYNRYTLKLRVLILMFKHFSYGLTFLLKNFVFKLKI